MAVKIAKKVAVEVKKPEVKKPEPKAKVKEKEEKPEKKSDISVAKIRAEAEAKAEKKAAKAEAKVEAKTEVKAKAEIVSSKRHVVGDPIDPAVAEVRVAYRSFAQTWLEFALKIHTVSESEAWKSYADTWSDFCAVEFPDLPLGTISKFLRVANDWGKALVEYREKKPDSLLPAYEACYTLSVHGDKLPKEDLPKIRKDLIEHKINKEELLRKLEPYRKVPAIRTHKFDRAESKRIEEEVTRDVTEMSEKVGVDDTRMAEKIDRELASDLNESAGRMLEKVKYIVEHLPLLTSVVEKTTINVVNLAVEAEKMQSLVEDYLTKIEKISA